MVASTLMKQLFAAQQLQLWSSAAAVGTAATAAHFGRQQRSVQASAAEQQNAAVAHSTPPQEATGSSSSYSQEQDNWTPSRALPPPSPYGLKITIKAHDLLLVKLASTAIRDLVMVNLAPKSRNVLPESMRAQGAGVPWVNLVSSCWVLQHICATAAAAHHSHACRVLPHHPATPPETLLTAAAQSRIDLHPLEVCCCAKRLSTHPAHTACLLSPATCPLQPPDHARRRPAHPHASHPLHSHLRASRAQDGARAVCAHQPHPRHTGLYQQPGRAGLAAAQHQDVQVSQAGPAGCV